MKHYTQNVICDKCNGEGTIIIPGDHLGHGRYSDHRIVTCPQCKGSGIMVRSVTVRYEPFKKNRS